MNLQDEISIENLKNIGGVKHRAVEVEVLDEDIKKGDHDDCHNCALARAIKRRVAPYFRRNVSVGSNQISVGIAAGQELPSECIDWIRRFDDGEKVEPFRFQIILPEYVITGFFD